MSPSPEAALALARERAAAARAAGRYAEDPRGLRVEPTDRMSVSQLLEWAVIEPELEHVRSTRRAGAPITLAKRALVRILRQYLAQVESQQSRFNLHVAVRVVELEHRIAALEDRRSSSTRS